MCCTISVYLYKLKIDRYPYYIHTLFIDIDKKIHSYINLPQRDSNQVVETPKVVT